MISNLEKLDYLIMNHAEPDHASAIRYIMDMAPKESSQNNYVQVSSGCLDFQDHNHQ